MSRMAGVVRWDERPLPAAVDQTPALGGLEAMVVLEVNLYVV
jgi:hypothetical protein